MTRVLNSFNEFLYWLGAYSLMVTECAKATFRKPPRLSQVTHEMNQLGAKSLIIVAVAALATGLVMAIQFGFGLSRFGAKYYVPKIVALSITRELGPIFTALMMAGRVGAGIAAEIGSMKVSEQVDAIRAMGTNPMRVLIAPKIIAVTLACPLLTVIADFLGIFGGMLASSSQLGLSMYDYFFKSFEIINIRDVAGGVFKGLVFGFIIGSISCFIGMNTRGGTQGVGEATTKSVVFTSITILIFDFILTKLIWIVEHSIARGGL